MKVKIDVTFYTVRFADETGSVVFDTESGLGKLWFIVYVNSARLDPPSQDNSRIAHAISMIAEFAKDRGLEIQENTDPYISTEGRERLMEIAALRSQRIRAAEMEAGLCQRRSSFSGLRIVLKRLFERIFDHSRNKSRNK